MKTGKEETSKKLTETFVPSQLVNQKKLVGNCLLCFFSESSYFVLIFKNSFLSQLLCLPYFYSRTLPRRFESKMPTYNLTLADDPLLAIPAFFIFFFAHLYVCYRIMLFFLLHRFLARVRSYFPAKIFVTLFSLSFCTAMMVRVLGLSNDCVLWIPFSYFLRFCNHSFILCWQLRSLLIIYWNSLMRKHKDGWTNITWCIAACALIPVIVFAILLWALRAGHAFTGLCTLGGCQPVFVSVAVFVSL